MKKRATRSGGSRPKANAAASGAGKVLLGIVLGGLAVAAAGYLYLHNAPHAEQVATSAPTKPVANLPAAVPLPRPAPSRVPDTASLSAARQAPFGASEEVFEQGASTYIGRCASCHGTLHHDAAGPAGQRSVQIFRNGRGRIAAQSPGQLFAAINLGAQGLGVPAYHGILSDREIWQLSLLLQSADQPLPDPVAAILNSRRGEESRGR